MTLTLETAQKIVAASLAAARASKFNPMAVVVLDARGSIKAAASEDGTPIARWQIAFAKANGAVNLGMGSRRLGVLAIERPHFFAGLTTVVDGGVVPVAGGVLIRDTAGTIVGAAGMSGDTSDNDEAALVTAITAAGLVADGG